MFFARVRWVGRVLDGAGINTSSKTGRELSTTLIMFSKYCQDKNRRGGGATGVRLHLGPAEWAVMAAILAPVEPKVTAHVCAVLGLSDADASSLLAQTSQSARELAQRDMPDLLSSMARDVNPLRP